MSKHCAVSRDLSTYWRVTSLLMHAQCLKPTHIWCPDPASRPPPHIKRHLSPAPYQSLALCPGMLNCQE